MADKYKISDFIPSSDFQFYIQLAKLNTPKFHVHSHEFSELVVILNGTGLHRTDIEIYPISAGDIISLNGDMRHGFEGADSLELCNIMYDPAQFLDENADITQLAGYHALFMLEPLYRQFTEFRSRLHLDHDELIYVTGLISKLLSEFEEQSPGFQTMIRAQFIHLVVYLSRCYEEFRPNNHMWQLAAVMNYIAANYTDKIRLEELASLAHLSTSHFERVFRETFQTSPIDYLIRLRLRKACELIPEQKYTISQIAFAVGFSDSNYFSRQFKRNIGKTPLQYRKELQGGKTSRPS